MTSDPTWDSHLGVRLRTPTYVRTDVRTKNLQDQGDHLTSRNARENDDPDPIDHTNAGAARQAHDDEQADTSAIFRQRIRQAIDQAKTKQAEEEEQ